MTRRRLLIAAVTLAVVVGLALMAATQLIDAERLKETALAEARDATGYHLEAGPASLQLGWSGAGIGVDDFRMAAPDSSQTLEVERADFYLKLLPLLRKNVELRELVLHRPRLVLTPPAAGAPEAPGHPEVASPTVAIFAVESWKVEEGEFSSRAKDGRVDLTGVNLTGGFRWTPQSGGAGTAEGDAAGGHWVGEAGQGAVPPLRARVEFGMNAAGDSVFVPVLEVASGALRAELTGGYAERGGEWTGAVTGRAAPVNWAQVRELLPAGADSAWAGAELDGRLELDRLRLERLPGGHTRFSGSLLVEDAAIKLAGAPLGLTDGRARARFEPGLVTLDDGEGRLGEERLTFAARVEGEGSRRFTLALATALPGPVLSALFPEESRVSLASGDLRLDLSFAGDFPLEPTVLPRVDGRIELRDLAGVWRDLPLRDLRGMILFRDGGAEVNDLGARWGRSDAVLNGVIPDLADPRLRFTLASQVLDLDEIAPAEEAAADDGEPGAEEPAPLIGLPATGWVEIARLRVRENDLVACRVHVNLGLDGLALRDLAARYRDGALSGWLDVTPEGGAPLAWRYEGELALKDVPTGSLVAAVVPGGERVEGRGDADLTVSGIGGAGLDPAEGLTVEGDLSLHDGSFVNISGLRSLAEALQVKEGMGERWPFRDLWMRFAVRGGRLVVDTLRVDQRGLAWRLGGSMGLTGDLRLDGTLRADPEVVAVPAELQLLIGYITESDGRIPLDFHLGGSFTQPRLGLDWAKLAARAARKAQDDEADKLRKQLEETITDPETLDRLKKLLQGKGGGG